MGKLDALSPAFTDDAISDNGVIPLDVRFIAEFACAVNTEIRFVIFRLGTGTNAAQYRKSGIPKNPSGMYFCICEIPLHSAVYL